MESIADQLERLANLRGKGSISEHEFLAAKAKVLGGGGEAAPPVKGDQVFGFDEKTWCTLMHISQLLIPDYSRGVGVRIS